MAVTPSRIAFVSKMPFCPRRPASKDPMMDIGPTHQTIVARRKPSTNRASRLLTVRFSHSASRSKPSSMWMASPVRTPRTREAVRMTGSKWGKVMESPIATTASPTAFMVAALSPSGMDLKKSPKSVPKRAAAAFTRGPVSLGIRSKGPPPFPGGSFLRGSVPSNDIKVRPKDKGKFQLAFGRRRWSG